MYANLENALDLGWKTLMYGLVVTGLEKEFLKDRLHGQKTYGLLLRQIRERRIMRFCEKLKIGEIKTVEPRNRQEWMRELLRILLDSRNGNRTRIQAKEKDLPRITKNKEENM